GAEQRLQLGAELLIDGIDLRQPERGDKRTDQAFARQVDAFAKGAAQHRKTDALPGRIEPLKERRARGFVHAPRLRPVRDGGMALTELRDHLVEIIEARKE